MKKPGRLGPHGESRVGTELAGGSHRGSGIAARPRDRGHQRRLDVRELLRTRGHELGRVRDRAEPRGGPPDRSRGARRDPTFPERLRPVDYGGLALVGLIGGAIPFLLFFHGLALATATGGAATASFLYRTLFLMATVFGLVFLHERFQARVFVGAALLLGGNLLLLSLLSPLWTPGTLYVFAATVLWAAEYTVSKKLLGSLRSSTVGFGRMGFGAVFLLGYLALTSQYGAVAAMTGTQWEWVAVSATLLTAFVLTWYAGLQRTDLSVATSVLVLGFPVTFVLGILARGTSFTMDEAVGAAAVVAGVAVVAGWRQWRDLGELLRATVARRASA